MTVLIKKKIGKGMPIGSALSYYQVRPPAASARPQAYE